MTEIKDKYDVVIVGAGIGGLTSGALLASQGMDVLAAERLPRAGGYCCSLRGDGFSFDPAVGLLEGCDKGGIILQTLEELGVADQLNLVRLDPLARIVGPDFDVAVAPKLQGFADELKRLSPGETDNIDRFLGECEAVYKEIALVSKASPDLMGFAKKLSFMKDFMLKCPRVRKYSRQSARDVTHGFFTDPRLGAIMHGFAIFLDPGTQATILMNMIGLMASEDVYYPRQGGIQALPDTLVKALTHNGGQIALETPVSGILMENGKAAGVKLESGDEVKARYVISNTDARQTFLDLIGEKHLPSKFIKELHSSRIYGSMILVSLGVDMDLQEKGINSSDLNYCPTSDVDHLFSGDPNKAGLMIRLHSLLDPSQAPEGKGTVGIVACLPYDYGGHWRVGNDSKKGEEYKSLKQDVAESLINSAENLIPGLSQSAVYKRIATPITLEQATGNSFGSGIGWYPEPGGKMRSQKTPIKNLYQAGHWTFPGGSVPAVMASGKNAAQLVLKADGMV